MDGSHSTVEVEQKWLESKLREIERLARVCRAELAARPDGDNILDALIGPDWRNRTAGAPDWPKALSWPPSTIVETLGTPSADWLPSFRELHAGSLRINGEVSTHVSNFRDALSHLLSEARAGRVRFFLKSHPRLRPSPISNEQITLDLVGYPWANELRRPGHPGENLNRASTLVAVLVVERDVEVLLTEPVLASAQEAARKPVVRDRRASDDIFYPPTSEIEDWLILDIQTFRPPTKATIDPEAKRYETARVKRFEAQFGKFLRIRDHIRKVLENTQRLDLLALKKPRGRPRTTEKR